MRVTFVLLLLLLAHLGLHAQIQFRSGDFQSLLAAAKGEGKYLFLDGVTATCMPCKRMAKQTFTDPEVATFFNSRFVNLRMDLLEGEGPDVQQRYNITDYPTLLIVDGTGDLVHAHVGFMDARAFLAFGMEVFARGFEPLSQLRHRYEGGARDRATAADYIVRWGEAGLDVTPAWEAFRPGMQGAALLEAPNWKVFEARILEAEASESGYFIVHRAAFEQRFGKEPAQDKFRALHQWSMQSAIFHADSLRYFGLREVLVSLGDTAALEQALYLDLNWHLKAGDWNGFVGSATALDDIAVIPPHMLNFIAEQVAHGDSDPGHLRAALQWSQRACAVERSYANLETESLLLYQLGHKQAAIASAEAAIAAAKLTREPYGTTEDRLRKWTGD